MAIQPTRPRGSSSVLQYEGSLVVDTAAIGAFPKDNVELPAGFAANVATQLRFLLADQNDADPLATATAAQKQLPRSAFDDGNPAANAPHANNSKTWQENTRVTVQIPDGLGASQFTQIDISNPTWETDTTTTGLGRNTGLPVLILPVTLNVAAADYQATPISVLIEVRHSVHR